MDTSRTAYKCILYLHGCLNAYAVDGRVSKFKALFIPIQDVAEGAAAFDNAALLPL